MGIPGGDNYVTVWNNDLIIIYMIDKDFYTIKKYTLGPISDPARRSRFDIMKDIPGTRIDNGSGAIGDYNNDGYDELFIYLFGGHSITVVIYGYDNNKDEIVPYLNIPFDLVDPENGPAPVEFMNYQGIDGVKVYTYLGENQYLVVHPPRDLNKVYGWYFYAWDEGRRKFVELAEIGEAIDYSMFTGGITTEPENTVQEEPVEMLPVIPVQSTEPETPETEAETAAAEGRSPVPVIGGAILIALGVAAGIIVLRRKKRP
jgi:hypothetical protein